MVFCSACGARIHETALFCPKCGAPQRLAASQEMTGGRGLADAVRICFQKYADFSGRAPRSEYWWWRLFVLLVNLALGFLAGAVHTIPDMKILVPAMKGLFSLGIFLPDLAVTVRRLHDTGRSGWWLAGIIALTTFIVALAIPLLAMIGANREHGLPADTGIPPGLPLALVASGLILLIYVIVMIIWYCLPGTKGQNRFGHDPLLPY